MPSKSMQLQLQLNGTAQSVTERESASRSLPSRACAAAALLAVVAIALAYARAGDCETARFQRGTRATAMPAEMDSSATLEALGAVRSKWHSKAVLLSGMQKQSEAEAAFSQGLHLSEVAVPHDGQGSATSSSGFIGSLAALVFSGLNRHFVGAESSWALDAHGIYVPKHIALAEELLLKGEQSSVGPSVHEMAAQRAMRLYQHARHLALHNHDAAAEWRYRASSEMLAARGRAQLASHSLARLSYFLMIRGRKAEALAEARASLVYAVDPLAQFLEATLMRSMGLLQTFDDVEAAAAQLESTGGQLPIRLLEEQRAVALDDLRKWRDASEGGFGSCFGLGDAAHIMLCLTCKAVIR